MALRFVPKVSPDDWLKSGKLQTLQNPDEVYFSHSVLLTDPPKDRPGRGRPSQDKRLISLRLSQSVIDKFKATGPGWQARMNEALKKAKL